MVPNSGLRFEMEARSNLIPSISIMLVEDYEAMRVNSIVDFFAIKQI